MQNPIWTGHISFGLVSISVLIYSAERRTDLHFHLLDARNEERIHYERINEKTGKKVPWDDVVKAYEFDKGHYVILKEEDFSRAAPKATKTIDIEDFVNIEEIDYIYFERPYFLVPGKFGEKGYVLLREALKKTNKVGIAKVVIRTKQYLAALMPFGDALILNLLRFPQELQSIENYALPRETKKTYSISDRELKMAEELVESLTAKWKPEKYHDEYREALMKWIEQKLSKGKRRRKEKEKVDEEAVHEGEVIDFMVLLKKSLAKSKHKPATLSKKQRKA